LTNQSKSRKIREELERQFPNETFHVKSIGKREFFVYHYFENETINNVEMHGILEAMREYCDKNNVWLRNFQYY